MRGACPPPPAPPASGKVPVPGTGRSTGGGAVGRRGRKIRNNVKLSSRFFAEVQSHVFAPTCRLQSIGEGVRACKRQERCSDWLVRGETRRVSPLSLPRTPLFYAERKLERQRGAGGAELPSGISRRNAVTTHIPLFGSGTLPPGGWRKELSDVNFCSYSFSGLFFHYAVSPCDREYGIVC